MYLWTSCLPRPQRSPAQTAERAKSRPCTQCKQRGLECEHAALDLDSPQYSPPSSESAGTHESGADDLYGGWVPGPIIAPSAAINPILNFAPSCDPMYGEYDYEAPRRASCPNPVYGEYEYENEGPRRASCPTTWPHTIPLTHVQRAAVL
ncbi:hypothetical protein DFH06DRAFT_1146989 [Mycena polygramma]|nr:hypothetical protein DFH06DRAFT_1146989 [Mycena polygramma]